ncbi:TBC [Musa troglodytarum]|uniref:TBC n=1 Tax=Musa troglodytarum TaxID=320322 RepID=A0A9E7F561_9LILI|nr:TBC [Musa troglodytarum]
MSGGGEGDTGRGNPSPNLEWRFNQTLRNVQGLLQGRSFPGKVLLTRKSEPLNVHDSPVHSKEITRSYSENDRGDAHACSSHEAEVQSSGRTAINMNLQKTNISTSNNANTPPDAKGSVSGARATDSARVAKFTKELSRPAVILEKLRELSWSGIPPYMRPNIWRLLLIAVDCPRTVPDVTFFQHAQIQKSLERILYTWAIRHPASGYVQGINDLVTPFLMVFLSEHLNGSMENWSISDLSPQMISNIEADCYWCLSKLLDGMQDHYTFAQPGIQRLVFRLRELVRRIDEPVSRHMEKHGLEFLQFAFRWFNCLLIREIPFHLVTRLWDTYLAEGDSLPDFLVYISASLLLTWSDKLLKLDFQEMVMFLQHLPTLDWTHQELEMVLSRAFMWYTMFSSSPSHLAS